MERVEPTAWTGEGAVTATLVVCALAMTGLAGIRVFRETTRTRIIAIQPERRIPDGLRLADGQNILGSRSARVRVVIFSDYQCEGCALMNQLFADLRALHPGDIAVVHHHFPLTRVHVHAFAASVASECAGEQGRFPAMHDALFRRQADIGARPWTEFARDAAVPDPAKFGRCLHDESASARVEADRAQAVQLRISGTPAAIVDGRLFYGPHAAEVAESLLASPRSPPPVSRR